MPASRVLACALLAHALFAAGCGKREEKPQDLTFETLADTSGLAEGPALVSDFEAIRHENGLLRVRGRARFPNGTRLRVTVKEPGSNVSAAMVQVTVQDSLFDSPPLMGDAGPLPVGQWRFELMAQFTPEYQPADVMLATTNGLALRGPGITRGRMGAATFFLAMEQKK
ncbi:MAG: hypothetical protein U0704_11750 [Candidatus Eisenbacteria bacterium]